MKKVNYETLTNYIFIFLTSIIVCLSLPSSPISLYNLPMMDSSVFYYIGRAIKNGLTLYTDATDHKGPIIFFINYFAVLISDNHFLGLWLIEVFTYILFLISVLKISKLLKINSILFKIGVLFLSAIIPFLLDASGNAVEFYALPCISWSLYIFCKYYLTDQKIHFLNFVISGILCCWAALLRFNQIGLWIGFAVVVLIYFLIKKEYQSLLKLMFSFTLGIFLGAVPFLIYHIYTDSLTEAINQSWFLNLEYVKTKYIVSKTEIAITFLSIFVSKKFFFIFLMYFGVLLIDFYKNKKIKNPLLHISILTSLLIDIFLIAFSGRLYRHYFVVLYPATIFCLVFSLQYLFTSYKRHKNLLLVVSFILLLMNSIHFGHRFFIQNIPFFDFKISRFDTQKHKENYFSRYKEYEYVGSYIKNNSHKNDKIYSQRPEVYIQSERFAHTRFFSLPYMYITKDSYIFKEFFDDFEKNKPVFIVMNKEKHPHNIFVNVREKINEFISEEYTQIYSGEKLIMYKLNQ